MLTKTASGVKVRQKIWSLGQCLHLLTACIQKKFLDAQSVFDFFTRIDGVLPCDVANKLDMIVET